jgi:23S rRNA (guanosine2251-2'-O)-methyltransferase
MHRIVLIVHNVRSAGNVGSMFRTADGLGIEKVYLTGYTAFPKLNDDPRPPHVRDRAEQLISKTALGAEKTIAWEHSADVLQLLNSLKRDGWSVVALEQTPKARDLTQYSAPDKTALIVGSEVDGLPADVLAEAGDHIQIPMLGNKESFNVAIAAALAMYHLRYKGSNGSHLSAVQGSGE